MMASLYQRGSVALPIRLAILCPAPHVVARGAALADAGFVLAHAAARARGNSRSLAPCEPIAARTKCVLANPSRSAPRNCGIPATNIGLRPADRELEMHGWHLGRWNRGRVEPNPIERGSSPD